MAYTVRFNALAKKLESLGDDAEAGIIRALQSTALRFEGIVADTIEREGVVNTGELKRSLETTRMNNGAIVSVDAPHAPFMEFGTRPHFPPIAPLTDWVLQKGMADDEEEAKGIAYRIAQSIAKNGIKPRFYMADSIKKMRGRRIMRQELDRELNRVASRRQRS